MANLSNFRKIDFPAMLRETLTSFFSINKAGAATWGYKFCAACLAVLIQPFKDFDAYRQKMWLIANCKWQIGQLTYVLNRLYDPALNRITIAQAVTTPQFLNAFPYDGTMWAGSFDDAPIVFLQTFGSQAAKTVVTFVVPAELDLDDLTATVALVAMDGIPYKIVTV